MNKVFEALERLAMPDDIHIKECEKLGIGLTEDFDIVEQALLELKSIKEAKPSEALEVLENVYDIMLGEQKYSSKKYTTIKQALLNAQEEHMALEIIKEKRVNVGTFIHLTKILKKDYEQCKALNNTFGANICETEKEFLTEEEFVLLKEVLE